MVNAVAHPHDFFIELIRNNLAMCGRYNNDFVLHLHDILCQSNLEEEERVRYILSYIIVFFFFDFIM
jgi:hypothetical protein